MKKTAGNEKGFALVMALVVMLLMLCIAGTAMTMSRMGYLSVGSERRYQLAAASAEYGVNAGGNTASTGTCPTALTSCGALPGGGTCTYYGVAATNIVSAGQITIASNNGTITNSNISTSGTISGDPHNVISVTNIGSISGSSIVASATDHAEIYIGSGNVSSSLITAKDQVKLNTSGTISGSNILAKEIGIGSNTGDTDGSSLTNIGNITGSLLFGGEVEVKSMNGNPSIGTTASPVMLIGAGEVEFEHVNGNVSFNGLIFANGEFETKANTGNFNIKGAVIGNSTSEKAKIGSSGNMSISFDKTVLTNLYGSYSSFMKSPPCSSTNSPAAYTSNTKMTVY